ncbi:thermonuclease family protein [Chloroflexota bacterium]
MHTRDIICSILIIFILLSLFACHIPGTTTRATVVIDGDTIIITGGYRVRYIGIDAPENGQPYFTEAMEANSKFVERKNVTLEKDISEKDKYGRLLYYVYVDNIFVNAEMVRLGYAHAKTYPPNIKHQIYLEAIENEARQLKRGIWK